MRKILFLMLLCLVPSMLYAQISTTPITSATATISPAPIPKVTLITTLETGRWPKAVEITPDGTKAYVTNFDNHSVSVYDAINFTYLTTIKTPSADPVEVDFSKDGHYAYVTGGMPNKLFKIDTKTDSIVNAIEVTNYPKIIVVSPDGAYCYVSNWQSDDIVKVDLSTFNVIKRLHTGYCPRGQVFTPDGKYTYIANFGRQRATHGYYKWDYISVIDNENMKVIKEINTRVNPRHLTITPDGKFVYCSLYNSHKVIKIDTNTNTIIKEIYVGKHPKTLKATSDSKYVWVANFGDESFSCIDVATDKVLATFPAGDEPCGLELSADGKYLWLTNWQDNNLMVFRID